MLKGCERVGREGERGRERLASEEEESSRVALRIGNGGRIDERGKGKVQRMNQSVGNPSEGIEEGLKH